MNQLAMLLAIGLVLAACADDAASDPTPSPEPEPTPTTVPESIPTPEPEPTPTPEPELTPDEDWSPRLLFSHQYDDPTGNDAVAGVAFSPDGSPVAAGYFMKLLLFDVPDGEIRRDVDLTHTGYDVDFSPGGELVGVALSHGGVRVFTVEDGTQALSLGAGFDSRMAFSPDGETVATGNRDGRVWVWSVVDGQQAAELDPPGNAWLISLAYSPDGAMLASGHWDGTVHVWDTADGTLLQTLENPGQFGFASQLAFSPDGAVLAVAGAQEGSQRVVRIWNVADGNEHAVLPFQSEARTVAFSPDGELLAVGTSQGVSLWRSDDLTLVERLPYEGVPGQSNWISDLAFSPDGTMLVAGHWNGTLELWQVRE